MSASGRSDDSMYSPWETMGDPSAFPIAHQSTSLLSFPPSILQHCPSFLHSKCARVSNMQGDGAGSVFEGNNFNPSNQEH
ncbi:hypothetical protein V6N13_010207 [Hibiscus sabdariffa]